VRAIQIYTVRTVYQTRVKIMLLTNDLLKTKAKPQLELKSFGSYHN